MTELRSLKKMRRKERRPVPVVGVLGCMAERLKSRLLEADHAYVQAAPTKVTPFPSGLSLMLGVLLPPPSKSAWCLEASVGKMGDGEHSCSSTSSARCILNAHVIGLGGLRL